jgi:catechol 2,3-dioxygenase-like lactoylglutathione lyase family enzyme
MKVVALRRIARNVPQLEPAVAFYVNALGFQTVTDIYEDSALAACLGVRRVIAVRLRLGGQEIELSQCQPAGAPYPAAASNDLCFQHFAIVTRDIAASWHLALAHGGVPISSGAPQKLPDSSGAVTAWKFRDPAGHPLELLEFPQTSANGARIDHTAISVADVNRSIAFYQSLGLKVAQQTLNQGATQDALDGLTGAVADVVALRPQWETPHVELLHYRAPARAALAAIQPANIAADRMIFESIGRETGLRRDPDGHFFILDGS